MSWVIAAPEYVAAAANELAGLGSNIGAANAAAAVSTNTVLAAGADAKVDSAGPAASVGWAATPGCSATAGAAATAA